MTSVVSICNIALGHVSKPDINALTEASAEARACSRFYEHARDTLLQVYPWRFAGKTQSLAEVANDKPGRWARAYGRPNDCLRVRWVRPQYSEADALASLSGPPEAVRYPHEVEGQTIYCNLSPAFLRYTCRLTDPTRFPQLFVDALSWHLATYLAMPLARDPKVRQTMYQAAIAARGLAEMADANEERETSDHDSEFVTERA